MRALTHSENLAGWSMAFIPKSPTSLVAQSSAERQSAGEGSRIGVSPAPLFNNELVKEKERH